MPERTDAERSDAERTDSQITQRVRQNINVALSIDCESSDAETVRNTQDIARVMAVLRDVPDLRRLFDYIVEQRKRGETYRERWGKLAVQVIGGVILAALGSAGAWIASHWGSHP